jgi:hypothetical protein
MSMGALGTLVSGLMAVCFFLLSWRAFNLKGFPDLKQGTPRYWFAVGGFFVAALLAAIHASVLLST